MNYEEKKEQLLAYIDGLAGDDIALAFSGGVDSSLLLKLCADAVKKTGRHLYAFTVHSRLHQAEDLASAKKGAQDAGITQTHHILFVDELEEAGIRGNPPDRCYLCKKYLFGKMLDLTREWGIPCIIEGTNKDDLASYRPGLRALEELGIKSPLAECGLGKNEVRQLAAEYRIFVADRPSTPCMATRFPYGQELDYASMAQVERGEIFLRSLGFRNVRIRVHGNSARIEIDPDRMSSFMEQKDEILHHLSRYGYDYITLDLEGFRSGSMDIKL